LNSTDEVVLDCGKQVDSRPPIVKYYWRRLSGTILGSSTYVLKYEGYNTSSSRPDPVACAPYDAFSKYL